MRITIYSHPFAPMIGGVETYIMSLAHGLARQDAPSGLDVTVVTQAPCGDWDDSTLPFAVIRRPSLARLLGLLWHSDVIHLAGPSFVPMFFALLFRKPVVLEHSVYQAVCPNGLLLDERTRTVCPGHFMAGRYGECVRCNAVNAGTLKSVLMLLLNFPRRWMCQSVARNVFPSEHIGRRVMLPRGVRIHHGTPDAPASPAAAPASTSGESAPACFVFVGRLVEEKGVSTLLRAAAVLAGQGREFRLKIIGDGPERAALEGLTDRYGLRPLTTFTGSLRGDALQDALRGCSATVMPSTWEDVAPVAAIEQLMQGRVLIASDIGGLGELVGDAGLRFPPGDADGLAACLRRVLDEPDLINRLSESARQRAKRLFRKDRMVAEHLALYRQLWRQSSPLPDSA